MVRLVLRLLTVVAVAVFLVSSAAVSETTIITDTRSKEERQNERANTLRERADDRAKANLRRQPLGDPFNAYRASDFAALSHQIARLGALLQQMRLAAPQAGPYPPYGVPMMHPQGWPRPMTGPGQGFGLYGSGGPTAKSVKALLEYWLVVSGNPRLAVGSVTEGEDQVLGEIVTVKEGSLVDKYVIDKRTGTWKPFP